MMVITILYDKDHFVYIMEIQCYTIKIFCNYGNSISYNKYNLLKLNMIKIFSMILIQFYMIMIIG